MHHPALQGRYRTQCRLRSGSSAGTAELLNSLRSLGVLAGWEIWIRTKAARSRAGSSTAKLLPIGQHEARNYDAPPGPATSAHARQFAAECRDTAPNAISRVVNRRS
jgi:hypothetical protein